MKQSKYIKSLIMDEVRLLAEACGCETSPAAGVITIAPEPIEAEEHGAIDRDEALSMVSQIASMTTCPMTSGILMAVVDELTGDEEDVPVSDSAWSRGVIVDDLEDHQMSGG